LPNRLLKNRLPDAGLVCFSAVDDQQRGRFRYVARIIGTRAYFSYVRPDNLVPKDHPLRAIRRIADAALASLSERFDA